VQILLGIPRGAEWAPFLFVEKKIMSSNEKSNSTRDFLKKRKEELIEELKPFKQLQKELEEVQMALDALSGIDCKGCTGGCSVCRTGTDYR
jgi:heterodisulfide reductase subunit C